MIPVESWLAFAAASAVLLVIPGPTILTVISYSVTHGRRAAIPLVTAVALGDSTALAFSLLGLGSVLAASSMAFTLVKAAGGAYLVYLGVKMIRTGLPRRRPVLPPRRLAFPVAGCFSTPTGSRRRTRRESSST